MEAIITILALIYVIARVVPKMIKKTLEKSDELGHKYQEQQRAQGQVPKRIKELYHYESQPPHHTKNKLSREGEGRPPIVTSKGTSPKPLTAYQPIELGGGGAFSDTAPLQLIDLGDSQDESTPHTYFSANDLHRDLRKGIIMKEILERKF